LLTSFLSISQYPDLRTSFYWLKPGIFAAYSSEDKVNVVFLRNIRVYGNGTVYATLLSYKCKINFNWTILNNYGNVVNIYFAVTLTDIEREIIEVWQPYTLKTPVSQISFPPIPGDVPENAFINIRKLEANNTSLSMAKNITVHLNTMRTYYKGKYVGNFLWLLNPRIIVENKPMVLYEVITNFKAWNITYEERSKTIYKSIYVALARLELLKNLNENVTYKVGSIILDSSRLIRTSLRKIHDPYFKGIYYRQNKTKIDYVFDPDVPKIYYDSLSGVLVAIALEEPIPGSEPQDLCFSNTFVSDILYNLFNITYISWTYKGEHAIKVNGLYRMNIKLIDTNIPLEKPVFGKVEGYGKEYSLFKVLLFSLALVLALVIVLFRRFR